MDSAAKNNDIANFPRADSAYSAQRTSTIASRQGDPQLQVIHENEVVTANLPLTSESLRELDRRLAGESLQRNESNMTRARSVGDLTSHAQRMPAAPSASPRAIAVDRGMLRRLPLESLDSLSVATSTTVHPSFHMPQLEQPSAIYSTTMPLITQHQPSFIMPLRPVRSRNSLQRNDELPEGVLHSDRQLSSPMCVCLGHRLW